MPKDSIIMHYLDSLVTQDAKNKISANGASSFFVNNQSESDTLNTKLEKKIEIIRAIRRIRSGDAKDAAIFFIPFADNYLNLQRAYLVVLQSYKSNIACGKQNPTENVLLEIADKMILAALLEATVFRNSNRHRDHLRLLEQLLYDLSADWSQCENPIIDMPFDSKLDLYKDEIPKPNAFVAGWSEKHVKLNNWRFVFARFWRWLVQSVTRAFAYCKTLVDGINDARDNGVGIFFAYLAWVFFIPRLLIGICTVIYSLIGTSFIFGSKKLPEIEIKYGWYRRLSLRLKEIMFDIMTDWMWFTAGLINCFSLAGTLPVIGIYIMAAAQTYDFCLIMLRNFVDNQRSMKFKDVLQKTKIDNGLEDSGNLIENIKFRIKLDKKQTLYAIFNFAVLLMCIVLMTPAFGNISPLIPLVASFITIILAPLRGMNLRNFRAEAGKLDPGLINSQSCGALIVDDINEVKTDKTLLGRYSKALIGIKDKDKDKDDIVEFYEYDNSKPSKFSGSKKIKEENSFGSNMNLFKRVKTVKKEFLEKFESELLDEKQPVSMFEQFQQSVKAFAG